MKRLISYVFTGILGGLVAYGLIAIDPMDLKIDHRQEAQKVFTSAVNVSPLNTAALSTDFIAASELATPAVVHIKAAESDVLAQQRFKDQSRQRQYRSPIEEMFGGDIFGRELFGGGGFHRQQGSGSGVILSKDGYIVTNNHVVGFADDIKVTLDDGREFSAVKIGTDPSTDLAVIKIESDHTLPVLQYADSDMVRVGEWVLAVGNPFDYLRSTVTAGIVSAKGRDLDIIKGQKAIEEFIQTDAAVNPGNSGGALVDGQGKLIGINTAIATPTGVYAGYSFAIPSNLVKQIVDEIIVSGNIERASLGVFVRELDEVKAKGIDPKASVGVYVDELVEGSSAQFAGILPQDVITKVDKYEIKSFEDLQNALKFSKVGDELDLEVLRNSRKKSIKVKLRKGI